MGHMFFSKNCVNTETHSFADIEFLFKFLDKENNHYSQALL